MLGVSRPDRSHHTAPSSGRARSSDYVDDLSPDHLESVAMRSKITDFNLLIVSENFKIEKK